MMYFPLIILTLAVKEHRHAGAENRNAILNCIKILLIFYLTFNLKVFLGV